MRKTRMIFRITNTRNNNVFEEVPKDRDQSTGCMVLSFLENTLLHIKGTQKTIRRKTEEWEKRRRRGSSNLPTYMYPRTRNHRSVTSWVEAECVIGWN